MDPDRLHLHQGGVTTERCEICTPPVQDKDDNPFKLVARYRKARAIALTLVRHGATVESIEALGALDGGRKLAAEAAGVLVPSVTTWALVVELAREEITG